MRVDWHGQSAYTLDGEAATVFIDPWGDMSGAAANGIDWDYPAISPPESVDLLIVTHEHADHNAVDVISGEPTLVRSVAGTHESPLGNVVAIASEHDEAAGTERGPNTIVVFDLDGLRVCHFGDFGQAALRPEQRAHLDGIDLLFLPVGGGPTIDGAIAATIAKDLAPSWVVPMHYKTDKINFLDTEESFVDAMPSAERLSSPSFDTADLEKGSEPLIVVPAAP
ncbi:MAG TPA: MBL fold metallo-hydrolase [Solirubrobacterales bacterium]|jgi:L-ascorbate metabolism protein UlaG (beta-lactamase superfamily)|nr:MBL fold metallo-hydrolase [Solirubrobacterales bacterium]